jgi:hypothetical protein
LPGYTRGKLQNIYTKKCQRQSDCLWELIYKRWEFIHSFKYLVKFLSINFLDQSNLPGQPQRPYRLDPHTPSSTPHSTTAPILPLMSVLSCLMQGSQWHRQTMPTSPAGLGGVVTSPEQPKSGRTGMTPGPHQTPKEVKCDLILTLEHGSTVVDSQDWRDAE